MTLDKCHKVLANKLHKRGGVQKENKNNKNDVFCFLFLLYNNCMHFVILVLLLKIKCIKFDAFNYSFFFLYVTFNKSGHILRLIFAYNSKSVPANGVLCSFNSNSCFMLLLLLFHVIIFV